MQLIVDSKEGRPYIKKGRNVMFIRVAIPIFLTRLQITKKFLISHSERARSNISKTLTSFAV